MGASIRNVACVLLFCAVPAASLPAPAAYAAGAKQPGSPEELERLERQLQSEGRVTQRVKVPESAEPRLLAVQNPCGDALGSCWSTVGCALNWCLCTAERSCLERQGQR
ncbi:hypothetical protein HRbin39_00928 [bacterium HR39]|nr:hypothetical protein HRbin39_00928 [bacterium HR39]